MGGFEKFCWIVTILASLAAAAVLAAAVFAREFAAPQEAVLAAVGVGIAIVPYVFTRGIQALGRDARQRAAGRSLPAAPAPAVEAAPRETPPLVIPEEPVPSRAEPAPRETPPPLVVPQEPVPSRAEGRSSFRPANLRRSLREAVRPGSGCSPGRAPWLRRIRRRRKASGPSSFPRASFPRARLRPSRRKASWPGSAWSPRRHRPDAAPWNGPSGS